MPGFSLQQHQPDGWSLVAVLALIRLAASAALILLSAITLFTRLAGALALLFLLGMAIGRVAIMLAAFVGVSHGGSPSSCMPQCATPHQPAGPDCYPVNCR